MVASNRFKERNRGNLARRIRNYDDPWMLGDVRWS